MSDAIIVGGGVAGLATAAALSARMKVTLLEAETQLNYHSSGRSAAMLVVTYGNDTIRRINRVAATILGERGLLSPRGVLFVGHDGQEELIAGIADEPGLRKLSFEEVQNLVPILRPEAMAAGAYFEEASQDIDTDGLLQQFIKEARSNGTNIVTDAAIHGLERRQGKWHAETKAGSFSAPLIVNAAGGWVDGLARMAGVKPMTITPMRRSAAILPAPEGYDIRNWPLVSNVGDEYYFKPEAGKLMVSPAEEDVVEAHDAFVDDMALAEGLHRFEQATTVEVTRLEHSWAGLRSFAPDRSPVVGFDPDAEGFIWYAGLGGYGIETSPVLAAHIASLVQGSDSPLDSEVISRIEPGRFG